MLTYSQLVRYLTAFDRVWASTTGDVNKITRIINIYRHANVGDHRPPGAPVGSIRLRDLDYDLSRLLREMLMPDAKSILTRLAALVKSSLEEYRRRNVQQVGLILRRDRLTDAIEERRRIEIELNTLIDRVRAMNAPSTSDIGKIEVMLERTQRLLKTTRNREASAQLDRAIDAASGWVEGSKAPVGVIFGMARAGSAILVQRDKLAALLSDVNRQFKESVEYKSA